MTKFTHQVRDNEFESNLSVVIVKALISSTIGSFKLYASAKLGLLTVFMWVLRMQIITNSDKMKDIS